MGRSEGDPALSAPGSRSVILRDADGLPTEDPAAAVHGEIVEHDVHGRSHRRGSFFLSERRLPWMPVSESAFLLWVLALLMLIWIGVGLVLWLT